MNAADILKYGQSAFLSELDGLPESAWDASGVCGEWSVKEDVIGHLASYEQALAELLGTILSEAPTPTLNRFRAPGGGFNDAEVAERLGKSASEALTELKDTNARSVSLAARIPEAKFREAGTLPWYGTEYSLDDFIVYTNYGHKREHAAQVAAYRDRLRA